LPAAATSRPGKNIVLAAPDDPPREILAKWLQKKQTFTAKNLPAAFWHFAPVKTRGEMVLMAATGKQDAAREAGLKNIRQAKDNGDGTAVYAISLGQ